MQKKLHPIKQSSQSISTIENLCVALSISTQELALMRSLSPSERYKRVEVEKKDGSIRIVHNPHFLLRKIQRRINKRIFANSDVVRWPDHVFGSIPNDDLEESDSPGRDYISCASRHCGAKSILTVDIKDFFDNIHLDQVRKVFREFFHYSEEVSDALVDICCGETAVLQGALTSSYIATLCLFDVEGDLVRRLGYKQLSYTRLVDDITISSKVANYDFSFALSQTESVLASAGLPLNTRKTEVRYSSMKPLIVHGLRVDFAQPRLPGDEPRRIRAAVKNLELLASAPGYRASRSYRKDFNRCMGRVNKLARVGHIQHGPLLDRLKKIVPLASHKDIERAEKLISKLVKDIARKPAYKYSFWFYKRFFVAEERLIVLRRSFPKTAQELRNKLKPMRPNVPFD